MTYLRALFPAALAGLALLCTAALAAGEPEYDTNRMGGDFAHVVMDIDAPLECRRICEGNPDCEAWTYVKPGIQGPNPMCWLKDVVPPPTANGCCISGVRPVYGSFEPSTNRYGGDYAGIRLWAGRSRSNAPSSATTTMPAPPGAMSRPAFRTMCRCAG